MNWDFLRETVRDHRTTGAVAPSSAALARALTAPVHTGGGAPWRVLEVGAGTGPVTRVLADVLPAGSHLDVVEVNPRFAAGLEDLLDRHLRTALLDNARVHPVAVQDLTSDGDYDLVVSSLPLTNFDPGVVDEIMCRYLQLLRPGGSLTWFGYVGTRQARRLVSGRSENRRHDTVSAVLAHHLLNHGHERTTVWANLPPAHVWRIRVAAADRVVRLADGRVV